MTSAPRILQYRKQINWADPKPDYLRILQMRRENLLVLAASQGAIPALLRHYGNGRWAEFISDWCMTFDPRELDSDIMYRPFILYERQIQYVDWVYQRYMNRERGLCKKFRGAGASWLDGAIATVLWLTKPNSVITLGSQKSEKVDNGDGDPDSLFWKVRKTIDTLPALFVPDNWRRVSKSMLVVNPKTGAVIRGEIGDQIGRGGRSSIVFADEFAELEHPQRVESALAETADCVLYVSTIPETGYVGSKFHELETQFPDEKKFIFEWTQDERKRLNPDIEPEEEAWFIKKSEEVSRAVFDAQYLLINTATTTNAYISANLIHAANTRRKSSIVQPPDTPWYIGVDATGMGADKGIIWRRKGNISMPLDNFTVVDKVNEVELAMIIKDVAKECLATAPIALIGIENDGAGAGAGTLLKYTSLAPIVCQVHTGARISNGRDYNLRAYLHRQAKEYLEGEECFIPVDHIFFAQATAIQEDRKAGLLLIESKEEYRARLSGGKSKLDKKIGKSPDRWDGFMLSFIPPTGKLVKSFTQIASASPMIKRGWRPLDAAMGY